MCCELLSDCVIDDICLSFGDCEECEADKKYDKEQEEANAECPYRKECKWVATDVKNDRCTTCGKGYAYS